MNQKIIILIICIVVCMAILILSVGLWNCRLSLEQLKEKNDKLNNVVSLLGTSAMVPAVDAMGRIKNISGREVTLWNGDENQLNITMVENVKIFRYTKNEKEDLQQGMVQEEIKLEDVKLNEILSISIRILENGQVQGLAAYVLPG